MKLYERSRLLLEPLLPPLLKQVRYGLRELIKNAPSRPTILDVGGRKSPYTIGLPANIIVIDLPRESEVQKHLNLGLNGNVISQIQERRSNIEKVLLGDMTCSGLPDASFDFVVSVEVIEHVEQDELFVSEIARVLKPGGAFLLTTPNGDFVKNTNPDHKRHYQRAQLKQLLDKHFTESKVEYAIAGGRYRKMGLKPWSVRHPVITALSIFGNTVNHVQSAKSEIGSQATGTFHLIGVAKK